MKALFIAAAAAALFWFGWRIMKQFDTFLEGNQQALTSLPSPGGESLRIGLSNPMTAEGLFGVLEAFSKRNPQVSVCLFGGTQEELTGQLQAQRLDVIFLPEGMDTSGALRSKAVILPRGPVATKSGGCAVEPIEKEPVVQEAVWREYARGAVLESFLGCLQDELVLCSPEE